MKRIVIICLLMISFFFSCTDSSIELGSGYWLKIEGPKTNEILTHSNELRGIPPSVLRYNYNSKFIIVEQKPNLNDDFMNESEIIYRGGRESLYYWVIIKDSAKVLGPLNIVEFEIAKEKYNVPKSLKLKSIY